MRASGRASTLGISFTGDATCGGHPCGTAQPEKGLSLRLLGGLAPLRVLNVSVTPRSPNSASATTHTHLPTRIEELDRGEGRELGSDSERASFRRCSEETPSAARRLHQVA